MIERDKKLQQLVELARQNTDIAVLWLYGSRAKNTAHKDSDYDLAVAFVSFIKNDPIEKRLRPECLALDWQKILKLPDFKLSIVDINQVSIFLAWEIIRADYLLFCRDKSRFWQEICRIHSRMELDYVPRLSNRNQTTLC